MCLEIGRFIVFREFTSVRAYEQILPVLKAERRMCEPRAWFCRVAPNHHHHRYYRYCYCYCCYNLLRFPSPNKVKCWSSSYRSSVRKVRCAYLLHHLSLVATAADVTATLILCRREKDNPRKSKKLRILKSCGRFSRCVESPSGYFLRGTCVPSEKLLFEFLVAWELRVLSTQHETGVRVRITPHGSRAISV